MDTAALKKSWDVVAANGDEVPLFFYSHLFLSHPELREMFPISMSAQRDKLVSALGRVVSNVDQLADVVPFVQQLGKDHRRFEVVADHYSAVGGSLLATLQHFLGPEWTADLAATWAEAYGLVAKVMVQAAEESADKDPAWWTARVVSVDRRTMDVTVLRIKPDQTIDYLPGQSMAMEFSQRPRLWRYYSPANAPRADGSFDLQVQLIDGGQVSSSVVRQAKAGDGVRIGAPVGDQLTMPDDGRDIVMVAGGTGLAPMRAVLEQVDRKWHTERTAPRIHLFHGARMPWNLYERPLMTQLAKQQPWFDYTEVVSDDKSYPGVRGLVGTTAAESGLWRGRVVLVCGSPSMVSHTVSELTDAGASHDDIRFERFDAGERLRTDGNELVHQGFGAGDHQ